MARIRTIKPQHCTDKELPNISLQAHLLWVLNWCFSDDQGVFENDPLLIKSNLFPRRQDIRVGDINLWLGQLEKARYIIPFTYNGVSYYINRTFNIHQKIDRPQASNIPDDLIRRILVECSTNVRPCIVEYSKGEESKGEDGNKAPPPLKSVSKDHLFRESVFFDIEKFKSEFVESKYKDFNLEYYYEAVLNWSNSKGKKAVDWIATARGFMIRDFKEGKASMLNQIIPQNATTTKNRNQPDYSDHKQQLYQKLGNNTGQG